MGNLANGIEDKFLSQGKVYYSYAACQGNIKTYNTGNEFILPGFNIIGDDLSRDERGGGFPSDDWEHCASRCWDSYMNGKCGSWSFDGSTCYLHSVDSCC